MRPGKDHTDGLLREAIKYFLDDQVHCAKPSVHYLRWLMNLLPVTDHGFLKLGGLGKAGRFGRLNLFLIKFQFLTWSGQQALVMFKTRADPNLLEVWSHRVENLIQADWMLVHTLNFHVRSARYQVTTGRLVDSLQWYRASLICINFLRPRHHRRLAFKTTGEDAKHSRGLLTRCEQLGDWKRGCISSFHRQPIISQWYKQEQKLITYICHLKRVVSAHSVFGVYFLKNVLLQIPRFWR